MNITFFIVFAEMRDGKFEYFGSWPYYRGLYRLGPNPRPYIDRLVAAGWKHKATLDISAIPGSEIVILEKSDIPSADSFSGWPVA